MREIASAEDHAKIGLLGQQLVALVDGFLQSKYPRVQGDADSRSQALGQAIVIAVMMAGNDVEWVNRVYFARGVGVGFGETIGSNPKFGPALARMLDEGRDYGRQCAETALTTRGRA